MTKYIYNTTTSDKTYVGKNIPALSYYEIQPYLFIPFSVEDSLLADIASGDVIMSRSSDSSGHITGISKAVDFLKGNLPVQVESTHTPFASKVMPDGSKLYKRLHGISGVVSGATDNLIFTVPYSQCKITGVQIINGQTGDTVHFKVLDDSSGTYYGTPNGILNQFGYNVNISKDLYEFQSNYDADLYYGMQILIEYDSSASDLLPNTIYINLNLDQAVPV